VRYFRIRNWRKFQRYSGRTPPWIKLYTWLIHGEDDRNWFDLTAEQRGQLASIWLLASERDNIMPLEGEILSNDLELDGHIDFSPLISGRWIEVYESFKDCRAASKSADAQNRAQIHAQKTAPLEREGEREEDKTRERERKRGKRGDLSPSKSASQKQVGMLEDIAAERGANLRKECGRLNRWPVTARDVSPIKEHLLKYERPARPDLEPLTNDESERLAREAIDQDLEGAKYWTGRK